MNDRLNAGSLSVRVTRPDPRVALVEAYSPGHREFFFVAVGEHCLTISAHETSERAHPEPRVHVIHKPHDWEMTPVDDPPSLADDQELLVRVWQLLDSN